MASSKNGSAAVIRGAQAPRIDAIMVNVNVDPMKHAQGQGWGVVGSSSGAFAGVKKWFWLGREAHLRKMRFPLSSALNRICISSLLHW